jgi:hypothetical protein
MHLVVAVPLLGAVCPFYGWSIRTMKSAKYTELVATIEFYLLNRQPVSEQRAEDGKGELECARIVADEPV